MGLEVNNLTYYKFNSIKLKFNNQTFYTIIGPNNSGKTMLFNLLCGIIPNNFVNYNGLSPYAFQRQDFIKNIGVIKTVNYKSFLFQKVFDELSYPLRNLKYSDIEIDNRISEVLHFFEVDYFLEKRISELTDVEKQMLLLVIALLHKPKVLLIDNGIDIFNDSEKAKIVKKLKQLMYKEDFTIINFTCSLDSAILGDKILVLNNFNIIKELPIDEITTNDKFLCDNNIEIPFLYDINIKLQMYSLLNKDTFDMKEMVDNIWP